MIPSWAFEGREIDQDAMQVRWRSEFQLVGALSLNDLVSNRVTHQFAHRVQLELPHDVGSMRFRGLHADSESHRDFLATLALREQLDNLTLARGEPAAQDSHVVRHGILL